MTQKSHKKCQVQKQNPGFYIQLEQIPHSKVNLGIVWTHYSFLFKKIRDTKGIFHAKMGSIKDRNGMDLIEAEDIKKRWQENTQGLYKKDFHDPDNHDGVISHLEPDILECEVKWALGSITRNKASRGDQNSS